MKRLAGFSALGSAAAIGLVRPGSLASVLSGIYPPHPSSPGADLWLVWTNLASDALIATSYVVIFACLLWMASKLRRLPQLRGFIWIFLAFGSFILSCAVTYFIELMTVWLPFYPLLAALKMVCAASSIPTAILFVKFAPVTVASISRFFDLLAKAGREAEDAVANYRGQIEAIDRSQMKIEFSMDGTILRANDNYLRAFGYTYADVDGKNHSIFVTEEFSKSKEYEDFWDCLRKSVFQSGLFPRVGKNGKEVWIAASYNPVLDAEGRPIMVVKFATDMTEQIKIQNELKDAEARLKAILNSVVDGIITIDANGTIVSFNPAATKMFEYGEDEVCGQSIDTLMPEPILWAQGGDLVHRQSTDKSTAIGLGRELEGLTRSGRTFPMELTVTEMSLQGQRFFVGLVRDITERKLAEEKSLQNLQALMRSNQELDAFAYAASHDLKAPLRVIHNASKWIEEDLANHLTAETRENMDLLRSRVRRMDKLLDDLLEYSRIGGETDDRHAEAISGTALMENIQGLLSPPQGFTVNASATLAGIEVFRMPLQQILINLISNAIKHHDKKTGLVEVSVENLGEMLRFSVKDDGPGIPAQYHEQIFKMFETLKPKDQVEGSGMGLAMVRKYVDMAGGEFTLESALGQGSTFSFTWPKNNGSTNKTKLEFARIGETS